MAEMSLEQIANMQTITLDQLPASSAIPFAFGMEELEFLRIRTTFPNAAAFISRKLGCPVAIDVKGIPSRQHGTLAADPAYRVPLVPGVSLLFSTNPCSLEPNARSYLQSVLPLLEVAMTNALEFASEQEKSIIDSLTGLYNRRGLDALLLTNLRELHRKEHAGSTQGLTLLMIDIDHFKRYNDTYGHQAGDQAIAFVGQLLKRRESDFAARYGGEEFALGLPYCDLANGVEIADDLRATVEKKSFDAVASGVLPASVTVSIGVSHTSQFPLDSRYTPENLLKRADDGLYAAKNSGRNRVCARYDHARLLDKLSSETSQ